MCYYQIMITKLDQKQKQVGEAKEVLDAIGSENEKEGIKWTKFFMDKWDKKEWEKAQFEQERLGRWTKKKKAYYELVHHFFKEQIEGLERPNYGYWVETGMSTKGVWLKLHDRFGKVWTKGMKIIGVPKYDHFGIGIISGKVEDLMWKLEESDPLKMTDSIGI